MSSVNEWSAVEDGNTHLDQYDLQQRINPHSPLNRYTKKIMAAVKARADEVDGRLDSFDADVSAAIGVEAEQRTAADGELGRRIGVLDVKDRYRDVLAGFRILGNYDLLTAASEEYEIITCQGFTVDTLRGKFIAAAIASGDAHQELKVLNRATLEVEAVHVFTDLGHANSLCYVPDADEIYVVPLLRDEGDGIVVAVLDAGSYAEKRRFAVATPSAVGQFALAYDKARDRFVCGRPCTTSGGVLVAHDDGNLNAFWIRVCSRNFDAVDEFIVPAPEGMLFGEGNGAACDDGILVASTFNAVFVVDVDARKLVSLHETQVDVLEVEDFDFDEQGVLYCHTAPEAAVAVFSDRVQSRQSLGEYSDWSGDYYPSSLDVDIDLNAFTLPGVFVVNTTGSHLANAPAGVNGFLLVERSHKAVKQLWSRLGTIDSNDHQTYFRTKWNGSWSAWHQLITDKDIFFLPGDSVSITYSTPAQGHGWVTSGCKDVYIQVLANKRLSKINSITITKLKGVFRTPAGAYAPSSTAVDFAAANSGYTVTASVMYANALRIKISKSTAIDNFVNNTPVVMSIDNLDMSFNYV